MSLAYIALGSNLGSRLFNCLQALARLEERGIKVVKLSSWYLTEPIGVVPQPWFINGVAQVLTNLAPLDLLDEMFQVEERLGRESKGGKGPRIIDLDLVIFDKVVLNSPTLTLPHPYFRERRFVLEPLAELDSHLIDPIMRLTVMELLHRCPKKGKVIPLNAIRSWKAEEPSLSARRVLPGILPPAFFCHPL